MRFALAVLSLVGTSAFGDVSVGSPASVVGPPQCGDARWRALKRNLAVACTQHGRDAQLRRGCRLIRRAMQGCSEDVELEVYGDTPGTYRLSLRDPRDGSYAWFVDTEREKLTSYKYEWDDCTGP